MAFTQKILENCEIPRLSETAKARISEIVKEILSSLKKNSDTKALEKELDRFMIYL